jgi:hypothetical protein
MNRAGIPGSGSARLHPGFRTQAFDRRGRRCATRLLERRSRLLPAQCEVIPEA